MNELLRSALQRRLAEVGSTEQSRPKATAGAVRGSEEELRVVMVRLLPRASVGSAERTALFAAVCDLFDRALAGDLRYLDAWNAAFERTRDAPTGGERDRFLVLYAELLRSWIARLS